MDLDAEFERTGAFVENIREYVYLRGGRLGLRCPQFLLVVEFIPKKSQLRSNSHFKISCREQ
jgi:hypothetical protein